MWTWLLLVALDSSQWMGVVVCAMVCFPLCCWQFLTLLPFVLICPYLLACPTDHHVTIGVTLSCVFDLSIHSVHLVLRPMLHNVLEASTDRVDPVAFCERSDAGIAAMEKVWVCRVGVRTHHDDDSVVAMFPAGH